MRIQEAIKDCVIQIFELFCYLFVYMPHSPSFLQKAYDPKAYNLTHWPTIICTCLDCGRPTILQAYDLMALSTWPTYVPTALPVNPTAPQHYGSPAP